MKMHTKDLIFGLTLIVLTLGCVVGGNGAKDPSSQIGQTPVTTAPQTTAAPSLISSIFEKGYEDISVQAVMDKIENKEDFILLDARTREEYEEGYIEGAILIPYNEIEERHWELNVPKDNEIIVYCTAGVRSKKGAKKLVELGYTNVRNMGAGTDGWIKEGRGLVKPTQLVTKILTTEPPQTTTPPAPQATPQTTNPPMTQPATTTPSPYVRYFTTEPVVVIPSGGGGKIKLVPFDTIQVEDAILFYEFDAGQCIGYRTWSLSVYKKGEKGWLFEGIVDEWEGIYAPEFPPNDWTQKIHDRTDALDDYSILVEYNNEVATLTITPKK